MRNFFKLHDYSENMKENIAMFSPKGKVDNRWEDVKNVKGIWEDDFTWNEFESLFKKNYLSKRYFDDMAKEFYELKIGSMTDEEYTSRFLELLRYVPYLEEEKAKVKGLISGLPVAYRDSVEFDEPRSLEEAIQNLKHYYE